MEQPPRKKKFSGQEERALIDKYKIKFEGPVFPACWPEQNLAIFTIIRKIEGIKYNTYLEQTQSNTPKGIQKAKTVNKVNRLVSAAYDCRRLEANEWTWRSKTELPLLSFFEEDIECRKCQQRRWVPDFCATTLNEGRVQTAHAEMDICQCSESDIDGYEAIDKNAIFAGQPHAGITDISVPEIRTKYPDRVIGLRRTPILGAALQGHANLVACPVKDADHIMFPFLIIEAKSEIQTSGFTAIEKQTAFPIKRLLDIQKDLRKRRQEPEGHSLVWFLAFSGDEWRLYGQRIFDLWHGCIQRHDSALQLCLIVDFICDWAFNIHRNEITRLLSGGTNDIISSSLSSPHGRDTHETKPQHPPSRERQSVIRDTNKVFFSFRHLTLPDVASELIALLNPPGSGVKDTSQQAIRLLSLFNLESPLLITASVIRILQGLWTGATSKHPFIYSDERICAHISFQSYIRPSDFRIVRKISCITASFSAINSLQHLAGTTIPVPSVYPNVHRRKFLPLARLSGVDSLRAAARNLRLTLWVTQRTSTTRSSCNWEEKAYQGEFVSSIWDKLEYYSPGVLRFPMFEHSSELRRIPAGDEPQSSDLQGFLKQGNHQLLHGAALLKTPDSSLKPLYPQYCLAVFDGSDLDNRPRLGNKLLRLITTGALFQGKFMSTVTTEDREFIHDWSSRLRRGDS
ncbi:Peptidase S58 DmpA/arginine biosynthesis protein ArgJ [Penicillium cf. griseofulvum]|nr:Peptidase S58 DmpA/arginine biosynthesis protein ArgJ [Penicillium cf. griseofulvum]